VRETGLEFVDFGNYTTYSIMQSCNILYVVFLFNPVQPSTKGFPAVKGKTKGSNQSFINQVCIDFIISNSASVIL